MCDFLAANLDLCAKLLNAACGTSYDAESLTLTGKRIWTIARLFNNREGISKKDDTIPPRIYLDPLPEGHTKGKTVRLQEFERMLTEYYRLWKWDAEGKPTQEAIKELGLTELTAFNIGAGS